MFLRISTLFLLIHLSARAQTLNIKGNFVDTGHHKQQAQYTLANEDSTICEGSAKKIKLALALNQNYVLTVWAEGFTAKSIRFSTHTSSSKNYEFEFTVVLHREALQRMNSFVPQERGHVFFDQKRDNFNYKRH